MDAGESSESSLARVSGDTSAVHAANPFGHVVWYGPICSFTCKSWNMFANGSARAGYNATADSVPPQFSYLLAVLFGVPASVIIIVTVFGNFLVLCFKAKVGKRQTTLLIWNLGLADFLVGVFVLPIGVGYVIGRKWPFSRILCRIWVSCDVVFCTASIVTLCTISVDRYIGVTRPLRYKLIVTKTKVVVAIVAIWAFSISILLATVRYEDENAPYDPNVCHAGNELEYVTHSVVFAFFMPTVVTLGLYWKIFDIAKRREKGLAQGLILAMGQNFLKECFVPLRIHCGRDTMSHQQQVIRMHKRVAKTLGVVVSAFLLCWLPFFSLYIISHQCDDCIASLVLDIATWFGYCNSMINPVIYAFTVDEFKRTLQQLFCSKAHRQARRPSALSEAALRASSRFPAMPPPSALPRSNRAYSLVPPVDPGETSQLAASSRRPSQNLSPADDAAGSERATQQRLLNVPSSAPADARHRRQNLSSSTTSPSAVTISKANAAAAADLTTSRSFSRLTSSSSKRRKPRTASTRSVENGQVTDPILDPNTVWNAKLYCTLISSQTTGL